MALDDLNLEYRARYMEISGESLPEPTLPSLPDSIPRSLAPIDTLLERADMVLSR